MTQTWTIHEVAAACGLAEHEIHKWISRGLYRPSEATRRGQGRRYDWCDLACLAVLGELRSFGLPLAFIRVGIDALRDDLARVEAFDVTRGVYCWGVDGIVDRVGYDGPVDLVRRGSRSLIIVDVAAVYREVRAAIAGSRKAG